MRPLLPKKFLFGAAVGTGMTALAAERGGADFLIILNAGRLRLRGASSLTCYLPLRDCNDWVGEIADKEILHRCESPVFMGAYAGDPRKSTDQMIEEAAQAGFSGIVNFPSSWAIDGRLRHALEQEGIGFARECELIDKAAKKGLMTLAYVNNSAEAQMMADAGAQ
ncbi:MAG: phosphoenolpyruvate hydrolase family protein, partial [Cohaesibacter sp.]|nr:phosphoenolpyruvate hydrolase family protein [Cohaesibacter sp.]